MRFISSLVVVMCISSTISHGDIVASLRQWDSEILAPAGGVTERGASVALKRTTSLPDTNEGQTFSLGVFKSGQHRVLVDNRTGYEELNFMVGYFVTGGELYFQKTEKHDPAPNRGSQDIYWDYTYNSSGAVILGQIELFLIIRPQVVIFRPAAYIYSDLGSWVSTKAKTEFNARQDFKLVEPMLNLSGDSQAGRRAIFTSDITATKSLSVGGLITSGGVPVLTSSSTGGLNLQGASPSLSANGIPVFKLDASGKITYASTSPLSVTSTAPSISSDTGALTVAGGLGVKTDAWISGVRVGAGRGANPLVTQQNTTLGDASLHRNTVGKFNTSVGRSTLKNNTVGSFNVAVGNNALKAQTSGSRNTAVGFSSLLKNTTGSSNASYGSSTLELNTTGTSNAAFGATALGVNTAGNRNTALGQSALLSNSTGSANTAAGYNTLGLNTIGEGNTALGNEAGNVTKDGLFLQEINKCVFIGARSKGFATNDSNMIVIGADAVGEGSNTTVIGNAATVKTRLFGETNAASLRVTGQVIIEQPQGDISMGIYE